MTNEIFTELRDWIFKELNILPENQKILITTGSFGFRRPHEKKKIQNSLNSLCTNFIFSYTDALSIKILHQATKF